MISMLKMQKKRKQKTIRKRQKRLKRRLKRVDLESKNPGRIYNCDLASLIEYIFEPIARSFDLYRV